MAFHGPTDRVVQWDNVTPTLTTVTSLLRGTFGPSEREATFDDLTGPGDVRDRSRPSGHVKLTDMPFTIDQDTGGSYDARADLEPIVGDNSSTRTVTITYSSGKTFSVECYLAKFKVDIPTRQGNVCMGTWRPTGAETDQV